MSSQHVLFEEAGQFKTGTILQDNGASLQVEMASGKRTKVKQAAVMLRYDSPEPSQMMIEALQAAEAIDLDFLWECAPQEEFDFQELAEEYFGKERTLVQSAALLMRLHAAPVYFYRKGKGRYRPAQPETLRAALAALERKRTAGGGDRAAGRPAGGGRACRRRSRRARPTCWCRATSRASNTVRWTSPASAPACRPSGCC